MAGPTNFVNQKELPQGNIKIVRFSVNGLFGSFDHVINFPEPSKNPSEPSLMIIRGQNGCGKTTILKMINGILALDFDEFRRVPFRNAELLFSNGESLVVEKTRDKETPILVKFGNVFTKLAGLKYLNDNMKLRSSIDKFRESAIPVVSSIKFELVDIHRSFALRGSDGQGGRIGEHYEEMRIIENGRIIGKERKRIDDGKGLSKKVLDFINEAQVNYRKFFSAEELELLPRIINRLAAAKGKPVSRLELLERVGSIKKNFPTMKRYGLQTDDADLETLENILNSDNWGVDGSAQVVVEAYVEMQENKSRSRDLIATRLVEFEKIMDDFLVGKTVRFDGSKGLVIESGGHFLQETDLSSGEYHFLYMMVTALLCYRSGSIIAIDEPELSLHVSWQRKVVSALARCASGASPLFLFATHSTSIGAQHKDRVIDLKMPGAR